MPYQEVSHPAIYGLGHFVFGQYLKYKYDMQIYGNQYLSDRKPKVFAPTHHWHFDPQIFGVSVEGQAVRQQAKSELWTDDKYKKFGIRLGDIIALTDAFPVRRGERDRDSVRTLYSHLASGHSVASYPQGTRSDTYEEMFDLVARAAFKYDLPLQPVVIVRESVAVGPDLVDKVRVIASSPLVPDRSIRKDEAVNVMMADLKDVFERDEPRAVAWAEHDTLYGNNNKRLGRIKRYA